VPFLLATAIGLLGTLVFVRTVEERHLGGDAPRPEPEGEEP
jgi:hypothetical protein